MKLIVGLGNPGNKYQNNRHNVGFMFIDYIVKTPQPSATPLTRGEISSSKEEYPQGEVFNNIAEIYKIQINGQEIILAKPQTYMNKSGHAVKKLIENNKLKIENLFIIHDDLDIPLGKFRIDLGRGPKLHNGITSIEKSLKTNDFWRIRIGVDNRCGVPIPGEAYVLQDFKEEEKEIINKAFPIIFKSLIDKMV